jgi:hypothetical protein
MTITQALNRAMRRLMDKNRCTGERRHVPDGRPRHRRHGPGEAVHSGEPVSELDERVTGSHLRPRNLELVQPRASW